jgi:arsenate reductase
MKILYPLFFISILLISDVDAQNPVGPNKLYPILFNYARNLYDEYQKIPSERRFILDEIANYIIGSCQIEGRASLIIIGSNNATRSILAEAWANAASYYYRISDVRVHSGGLNSTRISKEAILALEEAGFIIYKTTDHKNPVYEVKYSYNIQPLIIQSKKYTNEINPGGNYGAVFVCPNADINLPTLKGNNFRTSLYYFDPVAYEATEDAINQYLGRSREIAIEMFYLFYRLKNAK